VRYSASALETTGYHFED
jgi:hypothetical protein